MSIFDNIENFIKMLYLIGFENLSWGWNAFIIYASIFLIFAILSLFQSLVGCIAVLLRFREVPAEDIFRILRSNSLPLISFVVPAFNERKDILHTVKKLLNKEGVERKENDSPLNEEDQVFVKDGEKCWFVSLKNIRLFESEGNYVRVYFDTYRPLILRSLNSLETRLSEKSFFRASRKHIINLKWVDSIETWFNGGLMVKLKGGQEVEISRRQAVKLKDIMSL